MSTLDVKRTVTLPIVFPPSLRPITTRDVGLSNQETHFVIPHRIDPTLITNELQLIPITNVHAFHFDQAIQPSDKQQPVWNIAKVHEITDPLTAAVSRVVKVARRIESQPHDNAAYQPSRHVMCYAHIGDGDRFIIAFASGPNMNMICFYLVDENGAVIRQGNLSFADRLMGLFHSNYVKVDTTCLITAFTSNEAFVIRLQVSNDAPLSIYIVSKLTCVGNKYLCMSLNHRMCTATRVDCVLIDSNACIHHWHVDCVDGSEYSQNLRTISSSQWLDGEQLSIADPPTCLFAPDPRSLLVGLRQSIRSVDLRAPFDKDRQRGRSVALPELAAAVPVVKDTTVDHALNRELLPDHFFEHQIYRQHPARQVDGALYGIASHWKLPFLVALVTIDHVTLIDIRRSYHPLLDWNHGQHRNPPTTIEIVHVHENRYAVLTLHAQRQEALLFHFEMNGDACPCSLSSAQRVPSFPDIYAANRCFVDYGPPSLAAACIIPSVSSLHVFQLTHFGSVIHQHFQLINSGEMTEDNVTELKIEFDSHAQGLSALLQPSGADVPSWLGSGMWIPHNRVNVTSLFDLVLYGLAVPRSCVDPEHDDLRSLTQQALKDHVVELLHFCTMPRSAFDLAYHMMDEGWISDVVSNRLSSRGLVCVARCCFNQCVTWTNEFATTLRPFKVADRLPGHSCSTELHPVDDVNKFPVTRCSCSDQHANILRRDAFCESVHCHMLYDWHFHGQRALCAQLQFSTDSPVVKLEEDANSVDFSQDVSSLMAFVSQPDPESQSGENNADTSTGAIDQLLASFASDWQSASYMWKTNRDEAVTRFKQGARFDDIDFGIVPVVADDDQVDLSAGTGAEVADVDERDDLVDE